MSARKTSRAFERRIKPLPEDELDEFFGRYAHGQPLDIPRVRRLARSRRLRSKQRADAWKLVGYLHEDAGQFESAWDAYERGTRTCKAISDEILMCKAVLLRNEAVETAWKMLCAVKVSALAPPDRAAYWLELLDTAKLTYDPRRLRWAVRQVWKRDLEEFREVADDCEFCRKIIDSLESHYRSGRG